MVLCLWSTSLMNINEKCLVVRGRSHHATLHGISAKSAPWHEIETQIQAGAGDRMIGEEEISQGFMLVE